MTEHLEDIYDFEYERHVIIIRHTDFGSHLSCGFGQILAND